MLNDVQLIVGKIIAICSDHGSEILRGVRDFQLTSPDTRHISDTAHRVSNLLEAYLEKDSQWKEFRENITLANVSLFRGAK